MGLFQQPVGPKETRSFLCWLKGVLALNSSASLWQQSNYTDEGEVLLPEAIGPPGSPY